MPRILDPEKRTRLEQEESRLWRIVLLFVVLLATALAALSWERLHTLPYRLGLIPLGLLLIAILFATYAYGRRREVSELKGLLRDIEGRVGVAPSEQQLDQLTEVIARSQRSFKELIDSFDDAALALSLDGTVRTLNRRAAAILSLSFPEVVGHNLDEFIDEPSRKDADAGLQRFRERRRWSGTVRVKLKNSGRVLYFDCVLNAILKADEVVGVSALARDVTEVRQKETRFTELFQTLQEGVYFSTPEGKLLDANPALIQMLGYDSKEELLAADPRSLNSEPAQPPVLGRTSDDRGGVRAREVVLRRKDGAALICLDTSRAVWDPSGTVIRYQGTLVDVSSQRQMEKRIRGEEEFRRHLLESFPDLILVIGPDERFSFVSSRITDLLGFQPEQWTGRKVTEIEEQSPEFLKLYRDVVSGELKFGFCDYRARHRNGQLQTMRASAALVFDADEKPLGVVVSVRDLTLEKKLEQQIIQSERLAAMGQMIGGFAHELNNPLTSILGLSEMLQDGELPEHSKKQLAMMHGQARRATEIVQNLMFFSRPPAPGKTRVNLGEIVQRTLHLQAYSLRKNNVIVDILPEPSLPSVAGDPNQLIQVFLALVLNAEQAIRELRDKGTLRIRMGKTDDTVWVTFQDDGPGIPPENLPSIFDPFFTTKRPGRGTGLGLSICRAVVKEHGGNVEVASAPGGGAVFTVSLPITAENAATTSP